MARRVLALVLGVGLFACGGGGGGSPDAGVDATPGPAITSSNPTADAKPVSVLVDPTVTFANPIDPSTASTTTVTLRPAGYRYTIPGTVSYDAPSRTITFHSPMALAYNTKYELTLDGVADAAGQALATTHLDFTTYANVITRDVGYSTGVIGTWTGFTLDSDGHVVRSTVYTGKGTDNTWFTADDVVYNLVDSGFDNLGVWVQNIYYAGPGNDGIWGNSDDPIGRVQTFSYDSYGQLQREVTYDGPGVDGTWMTSDDHVLVYDENSQPDADGLPTLNVDYNNPGADGLWFTSDDLPDGYERTVVDSLGRVIVAAGYNDAGTDGVWFTADDHVGFANGSSYDSDGNPLLYTSLSGPGVDGQWGTSDDVVTGYDRTDYAAGVPTRLTGYSGAGTDGIWFDTDDDVSFYENVDQLGAKSLETRVASYDGPGTDGTWFTSDDHVAFKSVQTFDGQGNVMQGTELVDPGPDGVWYTSDDVPSDLATHDLAH